METPLEAEGAKGGFRCAVDPAGRTWPEPFVAVDAWISLHRQPVAHAAAAGLLAVCVWLMAWLRGPRRVGQGDDEPAAA